ncbi:MAG: hypothetical protein ACHP9Z_17305, partial [Streptosporangiales bacterium]
TALAIAAVLFAAAAARSSALEWIAVVPLLYAAASFGAYLAHGRRHRDICAPAGDAGQGRWRCRAGRARGRGDGTSG